jgi:sugar phosphate isomerase/epimerase
MKIACSSASFARAIADGALTQLEWLDLCANELEVDGVVFDGADFPRPDDDSRAQLKKVAADLGLSVAAYAARDLFLPAGEAALPAAVALGAPLVVATAPAVSDDPAAWGAFAAVARERAGLAKALNVTLAVRNAEGTMCATIADLRRLEKDVDSAWLRFACDPLAAGGRRDIDAILAKTVIAPCAIDPIAGFATPGDPGATAIIHALARFRGFIVLECTDAGPPGTAYHEAVARFTSLRTTALTSDGAP